MVKLDELKSESDKLKNKLNNLQLKQAEREVDYYFSNYYLFKKSEKEIVELGQYSQLVFRKLFKSPIKKQILNATFCTFLFFVLSIFSIDWYNSFTFSLIIYALFIFLIKNQKESLYIDFIFNKKIRIKVENNYLLVNKKDIANQIIEDKIL